MMTRVVLSLTFVIGFALGLGAQAPSPASVPAPQSPATQGRGAAAPAAPAQPAEPQGFTYNAEGRRDPFVSLLRRGADPRNGVGGNRPSGLPGLSISEVSLKGTVATRGGFVAILQGVDNKTYIVRSGDKLFDGIIRSISQDAIVLLQQVNDPLSRDKQLEVRKVLRQTEEAK